MENVPNMTPEELEKALEKAKRDAQAALDKMTPEEREQALRRAQQLIDEDQASMQKLMADAAAIAAGAAPKQAPKFCTHCGAQVNPGKFCSYCGMPYES